MSSGVCKNNDDEEKKERSNQGSNGFKFWIYLAFIILGLLLIIIIGILIYSAISSRKTGETNSSPIVNNINKPVPSINNTSSINSSSFPTFSSKDISSFKQVPELSPIIPSVPPPQPKKPFLSSLMGTTSNLSTTAKEQISSAYNRTIPAKKGGFRCFNRRRF